MPKKIKVAVIGGGNMGTRHMRTYTTLDGVQLVALADPNIKTKVGADQYGARYYSDYKTMLDKEKPSVVSVVVPTSLHRVIATEVMKRGIHCLLEKPIASTVAEADELIATAKKYKVVLAIGHIERFNPMVKKLKSIIENGDIGHITSVVVRRVGGFPAVEPDTDVIVDLAVHDIDVLNYLLGRQPEQIHGHGSKTLHSSKIDSAELLLDYGKASGFVQANWITPVKVRNIAVTGSKGYIEGNYITQEITHYKHSMVVKNDGFKHFVVTLGEPEKHHHSDPLQEPLAIELSAFLDKVRGDKKAEIVHPEAARDALAIVLSAINEIKEKASQTLAHSPAKETST